MNTDEIVLPEGSLERVYRYTLTDGPVVRDNFTGASIRVEHVTIAVMPEIDDPTQDEYDVSMRGTKLTKAGTPDPRAAGGGATIYDQEVADAFIRAWKRQVDGMTER